MSIVYYVANGKIEELELIKKTPKFYKVKNSSGNDESLSVFGYKTMYGGSSFLTTDMLMAHDECKKQIQVMDKYVDVIMLKIASAKTELRLIIAKTKESRWV